MKHPFIKSVLVLGAALALMNCSTEEATSIIPTPGDQATNPPPAANSPIVSGTSAADLIVSEPCWILSADQPYIITTRLEVFTINGIQVGIYDPMGATISDMNGTVAMTGVNYLELPLIDPASYNLPSVDQGNTPIASSASNGGQTQPNVPASSASNNNNQQQPASSASQPTTPKSSASNNNNQQQPASSASNNNQQQGSDGTCFDKASNKNVKPYDNLSGKNGESYAYDQTCTLKCYYDPAGKNCASIATSTGSNNNQQQQQQQPKSSSSQPKSSSSAPKSSSSQQVQQGGSTGGSGTISSNYTIKYVAGGKSGSGWATRYWDCCKPHCAWPGKGGLQAHACDAQGNKINDDGAKSMCDGGNAGICRGQFPIVVNDNLAFAFAAVPGSAGGQCGKCYDLAFTGKGKYATDNHKALAGKHLIVIASNIGYDVADGQFDIMIPGGGVGIFNGCSQKMGWGSQGAQYGGLLTECEESSGYKASTYKSCLTQKCNTSFSGDAAAKEGCLFLANWMNAAGNPLHEYKEVECPKELLDRF